MTADNVETLEIEGFSGGGSAIIYEKEITIKNADGTVFTALTSATSTFKVKENYDSASTVLTADETDGITVDPQTGRIILRLTQDHLSNISLNTKFQRFKYDWDVIDDNNRIHRIRKGDVIFSGDV